MFLYYNSLVAWDSLHNSYPLSTIHFSHSRIRLILLVSKWNGAQKKSNTGFILSRGYVFFLLILTTVRVCRIKSPFLVTLFLSFGVGLVSLLSFCFSSHGFCIHKILPQRFFYLPFYLYFCCTVFQSFFTWVLLSVIQRVFFLFHFLSVLVYKLRWGWIG